MRVAIYARVSDDKLTSEGLRRQDIDRQNNKLIALCTIHGWSNPLMFADDGLSAFKDDYNSRPQFVKLLREIRARRVQRVVIEDLTRWSRRIDDGLKTLKEASDFGCTVTSSAEGELDITIPEGWFKCAISFLMAEWSSRSTAYKVKSGMDRRLNDLSKVCLSCGIVHLGRHPNTCACKNCLRKGRSNVVLKNVVK
jgi:DNA invertase Pin-like site-specific DNA recombinase